MPSYRSPEYQHLILAERALVQELEEPTEETNRASSAQALVKVITLKREIRGLGKPKPVDGRKPRRKPSLGPSAQLPTDLTPKPAQEPPTA